MAAGEGLDESGNLLATRKPLQRQRCQLQPGNLALGALGEKSSLLRDQVEAHHVVEQRGYLFPCETQVICPDLGEVSTGAQAGERQGWVGTGEDREVHVARHVVQQTP